MFLKLVSKEIIMLKLQNRKLPNVVFDLLLPFKVKITKSRLIYRDKQAAQHTSKQKGERKREGEKEKEIGKERANKTARVKWGREKREANGK